MPEISLNNLLLLTIILGTISIYITKKISKTIISAATGYWFAWTFLLLGSYVAVNNEWILGIDDLSLYYIKQLHYGAFIGFIFGTIISQKNKSQKKYNQLVDMSVFITNKFTDKALKVLFVFGLVFLIQRIIVVGFTLNYFEEVRKIYLERNISFVEWAGTHISVIVSFLIILLGIKDSRMGIDAKTLLKFILASAPLGLANGGRMFLLNYLILYLASLLISRGTFSINNSLLKRNELKKIIIFLSAVLLIFSLIGFDRGGYGENFNLVYTILIWPVSTITAMGSWITMALASKSTNGLFTFGWVVDFLNRIGLVNYSVEQESISNILNFFNKYHNPAEVIPKSILPELIFDWGKNGVFWSILIISFLLQVATIKLVGRSIFTHTLAVLCLIGAFMTIQLSVIGNSFVATLFWSLIIPYFIKDKTKKLSIIEKRNDGNVKKNN